MWPDGDRIAYEYLQSWKLPGTYLSAYVMYALRILQAVTPYGNPTICTTYIQTSSLHADELIEPLVIPPDYEKKTTIRKIN